METQTSFATQNYEYEDVVLSLSDIWEDSAIVGPEPDREFIASVEEIGIIYPIVISRFNGFLYLIDGGRRIKAARRVGKTEITAKIYNDIDPQNQAVWSIILNERRSANPVAEFMYYRRLIESGNWDVLRKEHQFNKAHIEKILSLENLGPREQTFFEAFQHGKIAESTLFGLAKLGETRQKYLLGVLESTGKITAQDLRKSKDADKNVALAGILENMDMPEPQQPDEEMFLVLDPSKTFGDGGVMIFTDWHEAYREKTLCNGKMYRLVEV